MSGEDETAGDPDFMTSLARGLQVLQQFETQATLTTSQGAAATGLSRAAVRRCLYTLEKLGYIGATEGGAYRLRPAILPLARAYLSAHSFADAAQPVLTALRDRLGESCSLGVLDHGDVFYVARAEATKIMSVALWVGSRLPAYCTSMGRVLLAHRPAEEIEAYLAQAPFPTRTPRTRTSAESLRAALTAVREQGYAVIDEELEVGLRSIAVPVRNRRGEVIAALNTGAPTARASIDTLLAEVLPQLRAGADQVGLYAEL